MAWLGQTARTLNLKLRIGPWGLITACGFVAAAATIFGFLGRFSWFFDLFAHFRVQYFLGLTLLALLLLPRRRYAVASWLALFAGANLVTILPLYVSPTATQTANALPLRAMLMNVNTASGKPSLVGQAILLYRPDILVLEEVNDRWLEALAVPLQVYAHSKAVPQDDNFGIAVYSRWPVVRGEVRFLGGAGVPSILVELEAPEGRLTVIATHPVPPGGAENTHLRNDQLAQLPDLVKQAHSPVLLLGDLNTTSWSHCFSSLLRRSSLQNSAQGHGIQPTWPTFMPLLRIPIDHCLHSTRIEITGRTVGPNVGSDHYPLIVDFVLKPEATLPSRQAEQ